jgi:aryl-alcohol dehydrogenase-like predicted oxidoreductase
MVWGYGKDDYDDQDLKEAYQVCFKGEVRFFDTAEVYGSGHAETLLGKFIESHREEIFIASKFMPYPWRLQKGSLGSALRKSLKRINTEKLDLYQIHWLFPPVPLETWMKMLALAKSEGLIGELGVSNFSLEQTRRSQETLQKIGYRLCSNQVEYHLLNRQIEKNGVMDYCRQNGIKIIAYSPLAQGILTGKYTPENPPAGVRGYRNNRSYLHRIQPLIQTLKVIGEDHGGRTPAQVAINWTIHKGTLPIPGVKNALQAKQNLESIGWKLTEEEVERLDQISERMTNR